MSDRFVVVGGDAAGLSAASKAKRDASEMDVVVVERGDWISYGACGLPYYVKGEIADLEDLVVLEPRKVIEERGIDLRRHHEAIAIDRERTSITVETESGERYEQAYDDLLVATGGRASLPDVPGRDLEGVFSIRSLEAGRALKNYIAPHDAPPIPMTASGHGSGVESYLHEIEPDAVAVVGANKIGIELAEAFLARGLSVRVFEEGERALPSFGSDIAGMVEDHLRKEGVDLHLGVELRRFWGDSGRLTRIETDDGEYEVDAVVADVGIEPEVELAAESGIDLGQTGAIATDAYGRTSDPHVYAAGDCAEKRHLVTGEPVHWPYALAANRAGRAVGRTVAGRPMPVGGIVGTAVMKAIELQVARTGIVDHDEASSVGFDPVSSTITTITRAHYYPGWSRLVVHATADAESGRLLGVNMAGREGVAHRINAAATAITAEMTVEEVGTLDYGYAPPFGPVWDPILGVAKVLGDALEER